MDDQTVSSDCTMLVLGLTVCVVMLDSVVLLDLLVVKLLT